MDAQEPGLADRLRQGLSPDELSRMAPTIAEALRKGDVSPGQYTFSPGDGESRESRESRRAAGTVRPKATAPRGGGKARAGRSATADEVPPWASGGYRSGRGGKPPGPDLPGPVQSGPGGRSAGDVLELYAALVEMARHPVPPVRKFYSNYVGRALEAIKNAPSDLLAKAWGYMFIGMASGDDMLALLARQLGFAVVFQVTAEMVGATSGLLEKYARSGADRGTVYIDASDFPMIDGERAISGFAWLNEPVLFTDPDGKQMAYRALSWCRQEAEFESVDGERLWGGARITAWISPDDQDSFTVDGLYDTVRPHMPLVVAHSIFVPFGQRFALRDEDGGVTPDDVTWWLRTLWLFLGGQVVVEGHVERHARRRAERTLGRSIPQGAVKVILLRRAYQTGEPSGEGGKVDWSCRWTVDPFVRHRVAPRRLGYAPHKADPVGPEKLCSVCGGATSSVSSFTKGPSWAPFRTNKKIYKLVRLVMFYCPECAKKKGWPESLARSQGSCEVCGTTAVCYDTPSKYLLGTPTEPVKARKFIDGAMRDVVWSEMRDSGGMFESEVGVWQDEKGFVAWVLDWGSGARSPHHRDRETAQRDIERLWAKVYG